MFLTVFTCGAGHLVGEAIESVGHRRDTVSHSRTKPCSCLPSRFNPSWPARAADLNVTFNQYGQPDQASSRDRLLWTTRLLHFDRADFSMIWVKERQEWWGRVRRRDPQASAGA
jgi:hypothetical protein